jgi:hypothetical protein
MIDETILAQINGAYICPPDAGPAWRAAHAAGMDMSLIEERLKLTPWERLLANDSALALVRAVQNAKPVQNGEAH